jgi:hypothetical protein
VRRSSDVAESHTTEVAARVVYVAVSDVVVSCVVTIVNTTAGVAGFAARALSPPFVHEKVCTTAASCEATVRVSTVPAPLVKAVTVPVALVHVGTLLSTNTASSEVVVITIVSDTSLTPSVPVFNTVSNVKVNLILVGVRPWTSSFDVAAEIKVA